MSIALLRGQEIDRNQPSCPNGIPPAVVSLLRGRALTAGKTIELQTFSNESDVVDCLVRANAQGVEFVLLDPGKCAASGDRLRTILNALTVPYIEVHDDQFGAMDAPLSSNYAPRMTLIQGFGAQSYTLALSIALEHLGCAECENDIHVGT